MLLPQRLVPLMAVAAIILVGAQARNWTLSRDVAPDSVLKHFPLEVGNRWLYETKYLTGDAESPHVDQWIWEVRIIKHRQTDDGLIVFRELREVQVLKGNPDDQFQMRAAPYLVRRDGYVYELPYDFWVEPNQGSKHSPTPDGTTADQDSREEFVMSARKEVIERLRKGEFTPSFFFPMKVGLMWAERQREDEEAQEWRNTGKEPDSFYHWVVIAKGGRGHCACMNLPASAYDILYFTVGGPSEVFFQDGVGVIGEWNRHNGTYWEEFTTLKEFIPAPGTTQKR